jgi:hypothetical protein
MDGVVRAPSLFSITLVVLPSMMATQRVGGAEVDTDNFSHGLNSSKKRWPVAKL